MTKKLSLSAPQSQSAVSARWTESQSHAASSHSRSLTQSQHTAWLPVTVLELLSHCSGTAFALFWHYFRTILSLFLRGVASRITLFSPLSSPLSSRLTRASSGPAASHSHSLSVSLSIGLSADARYGRDLLCRPDRATLRRAAAAASGGGGEQRQRLRRQQRATVAAAAAAAAADGGGGSSERRWRQRMAAAGWLWGQPLSTGTCSPAAALSVSGVILSVT